VPRIKGEVPSLFIATRLVCPAEIVRSVDTSGGICGLAHPPRLSGSACGLTVLAESAVPQGTGPHQLGNRVVEGSNLRAFAMIPSPCYPSGSTRTASARRRDHVLGLGAAREVPIRRYRYETLRQIAWPLFRVARFVNWCGHAQELIPVPDDAEWCASCRSSAPRRSAVPYGTRGQRPSVLPTASGPTPVRLPDSWAA